MRTSSNPDARDWRRGLAAIALGAFLYWALVGLSLAALGGVGPRGLATAPLTFLVVGVSAAPAGALPAGLGPAGPLFLTGLALVLLIYAATGRRRGWIAALIGFLAPGGFGAWLFFTVYD